MVAVNSVAPFEFPKGVVSHSASVSCSNLAVRSEQQVSRTHPHLPGTTMVTRLVPNSSMYWPNHGLKNNLVSPAIALEIPMGQGLPKGYQA